MWATGSSREDALLRVRLSMESSVTGDEIIVDCPYCNHAWKAEARWISGPCPNCGRMVYRYMDPKHD